MALTPLNGFTTKVANFADKPNASMSATEVKAQFDAAPEELRAFINNLINQLNTDFALKSEIASALLGQLLDGSLIDLKLSNDAGQVKDRLSKVITDSTNFIATKGVANGLASLDNTGKLTASQKGISIKTGTISHGGTIPQTAGYANYIYFVSINAINCGDNGGGTFFTWSTYCSVNQSTRVVTCYISGINYDTPVTYTGTANYLEIAW